MRSATIKQFRGNNDKRTETCPVTLKTVSFVTIFQIDPMQKGKDLDENFGVQHDSCIMMVGER